MSGGCYLDTMTVISYDNVATGKWEEMIVDEDEYDQFCDRWGTAHHEQWYVIREFVVHSKRCAYSACPWQQAGKWDQHLAQVDARQPNG